MAPHSPIAKQQKFNNVTQGNIGNDVVKKIPNLEDKVVQRRLNHEDKRTPDPINIYRAVKLCDEEMFEKFKCGLGDHLLERPVQNCRGELACEDCYNEQKRDDSICPIDKLPVETKEMRDRAKEKDIKKLECFCNYRTYNCSWTGKVGELEEHLKTCPVKPLQCKLCGGDVHPLELNAHLEVCPKFILDRKCLYQQCSFTMNDMEAMKTHLQTDVIFHAYLHTSAIMDLQEEVKEQSTTIKSLLKEQEASKKNSERNQSEMKEMKEAARKNSERNQSEMEEMKKQIKFLMESLQKNQEKNDALESKFESKMNVAESSRKSDSLSEVRPKIEQLSTEMAIMNKTVAELDLRQQLHENTNFDGKLVWKIDNISHRMQQAEQEKITALHSAPTYSGRHGYKFCARLYLNGDGIGKNKCVSLFFVLMKSEYDDILSWPFRHKVTFRLINQANSQNHKPHKIESFVPDKRSASFVKPKKEMNVASGTPLFIEKTKLCDVSNGFLKNNCIYIEVEVEQPTPEGKRKTYN